MNIKIFLVFLSFMIFLGIGVFARTSDVSKSDSKMTMGEKIDQYRQVRSKSSFLGSFYQYVRSNSYFDASLDRNESQVLVMQVFTFDSESIEPNHDFVEFFIIKSNEVNMLQSEYQPSLDNVLAYGCDGCSEKKDSVVEKDGEIKDKELVFLKSDFSYEVRSLLFEYKNWEKRHGGKKEKKTYLEEKEIFRQAINNNNILIIYKIASVDTEGKLFWNKIFIGFKINSSSECLKDSYGWNVLEVLNIDEISLLIQENNVCSAGDINSKSLYAGFSDKMYCGRWYALCQFPFVKFDNWKWGAVDTAFVINLYSSDKFRYHFIIFKNSVNAFCLRSGEIGNRIQK